MDGTALVGMGSASARLPARQREALELHELQGHSYEAIAAKLDTSSACVAQLIGHARINLYDELHGTILASVSPSPDCERALGLIAAREDGELGAPSEEGWLDDHLEDCNRCQRGVVEMSAAATAYRGETAGARSVESPDAVEATAATAAQPAAAAQPSPRRRLPRRRLVTAAALGLLLGITGLAAALSGDDSAPSPAEPAADAAVLGANSGQADGKKPAKQGAAAKKQKQSRSGGSASLAGPEAGDGDTAYVPEAAASPVSSPTPAPASSGSGAQSNPRPDPTRPSAGAVVQSPTKPTPQPTPTPSTAPEPAPAPAPEPPPSELPTQSNKPAEPPGQSGD
ncbi:MAG TPA: sigma factor-like helix-turn-helix DNA-binding protein, partial [Solirubrobacterales bacterium]|nr:sigma factor-like helix-turn-helix DNA-binding protein [Solirubrobacterales bacterium]